MPKAFVELAGVSLLRRSLTNVLACPQVDHVVIVAPPTYLVPARELIAPAERPVVQVVAGGATRTESVAHGLAVLDSRDGIVLVHDAARALAPPSLFAAVVAAIRRGQAAVIPGLPVADTIKQVDDSGRVTSTPARESLRAIQTPQGFLRETLVRAHDSGREATDDAALVEAVGSPVTVIDGDPLAMKITTADDLHRAQSLLAGTGSPSQPAAPPRPAW